MDALKRAEESKRQAEGKTEGNASASNPPTLLPVDAPRGSSLPDLSLHYDSVDADLAAVSAEASTLRRVSASAAKPSDNGSRDAFERAAARNVFTAKKKPPSRPNGLWLFLGLSAIVVVGFCAYFWWQLQAASKGSLSQPVTAQAVTPPAPSATSPSPASMESPVQTAADAGNPIPETPSAVAPVLPPSPEPLPAAEPAPAPRKTAPVATPAAPESPVRLSHSQPKSNQTLEQAYEALQTGRLEEAQRGYEAVLRNDAKNVDALLGMATLAARQGQNDWAQSYYQRALESDPNDPTAQAGLINLRGATNPGSSESQLKTALAGQPDSSPLYFALGNLYARQERWSEAQQAYFRAYSNEPNNADFMFNLAVSLDHLHQNKLAVQYYQMALDTAGTANASFDKKQVNARLLDLQP
jgi:tetratricopeptide (TPR) repeat protein